MRKQSVSYKGWEYITLDETDPRQSPSQINLAADHELYHHFTNSGQPTVPFEQPATTDNLLGVEIVDGVVQFDKTNEILSYYRKFIPLQAHRQQETWEIADYTDDDVQKVALKFPWGTNYLILSNGKAIPTLSNLQGTETCCHLHYTDWQEGLPPPMETLYKKGYATSKPNSRILIRRKCPTGQSDRLFWTHGSDVVSLQTATFAGRLDMECLGCGSQTIQYDPRPTDVVFMQKMAHCDGKICYEGTGCYGMCLILPDTAGPWYGTYESACWCAAGFYYDITSNKCKAVTGNFFAPNDNLVHTKYSYALCAQGHELQNSYTSEPEINTGCTACPAGKYGNILRQCVFCEKGKYSLFTGQESCDACGSCPEQHYRTNCKGELGSLGAGQCVRCDHSRCNSENEILVGCLNTEGNNDAAGVCKPAVLLRQTAQCPRKTNVEIFDSVNLDC